MELRDTARVSDAPSAVDPVRLETVGAAPEPPVHDQCEACGAAVAHDQRYCVACGVRRQHVRDPAVRFLSRASAAARSERARPRTATGSTRHAPSLAVALLVAVVPLSVALGVLVGRASTAGDAKLIAEIAQLQARRADVVTTAGTSTSSTTASSALAPTLQHTAKPIHAAAKTKAAKTKAAKTVSSTQPTATHQLTSKPPTQQQLSQGASVVKKEQQSSGKSYVNSQQGLPSQVSVP